MTKSENLVSVRRPVTPLAVQRKKKSGEPITLVTAYDYPIARYADLAEIDIVFVSDAFAVVGLGRANTSSVTVDEVVYHTKAVRAGSGACLVLSAMPLLSHGSRDQALASAGRLIKEGGADAVEVEGGQEVASVIEALRDNGVAVVGHVGLTKQASSLTGSHATHGKSAEDAVRILKDAQAVQEAGAFALVLECIPDRLAEHITSRLSIPTIGIGAGPHCNGQGLVAQDMLGLFDKFCPKFVKRYRETGKEIAEAFSAYRADVIQGNFPGIQQTVVADAGWSTAFNGQLGLEPKPLVEKYREAPSRRKR